MQNKIEHALKEYGKKMDLPYLEFDESGHCPLHFDENLFINLQIHQPSGNLLIFSSPGKIKNNNDSSILRQMLMANAFWQETGGATLSIVDNNGTAMLAWQTPEDSVSPISFEANLDCFTKALKYWTDQLSAQNKTDQPHTTPTNSTIHLTKRA